jgi:hypothetical protein
MPMTLSSPVEASDDGGTIDPTSDCGISNASSREKRLAEPSQTVLGVLRSFNQETSSSSSASRKAIDLPSPEVGMGSAGTRSKSESSFRVFLG